MWSHIPGKLQSASVADKTSIWGVTLDLQLCKFHVETQQWRLVSVTSEFSNRSHFSATSAQSDAIGGTSSTPSSLYASAAARTISSLFPFRASPTLPSLQQQLPGSSSSSLSEYDTESDSTILVSAASDGTVVRLDKTQRSWYLVTPQEHVDFEKEVFWIDLGQSWKCVSVASVSQIWGLDDHGGVYYGTTDRFERLESSVTSGAGYDTPRFTYVSVGHDNLVLATDAYTGTVFRLKTHPTASHPPIWTALPGTGSRMSGVHIVQCALSMADFIVGVALDGQVYRFRNSKWIPIGGDLRLDRVSVGVDGFVLGINRNSDLFSCQLESSLIIPQGITSRGIPLAPYDKSDDVGPNSPQAPNLPDIPPTPHLQTVSKRPVASPRELFEMGAPDRGFPFMNYERVGYTGSGTTDPRQEARSPLGTEPSSRNNSFYARYKHARSDSQQSKSSYASDMSYPGLSMTGSKTMHRGASSGLMTYRPPEMRGALPLRIQTRQPDAGDQADEFRDSCGPNATSRVNGSPLPTPTNSSPLVSPQDSLNGWHDERYVGDSATSYRSSSQARCQGSAALEAEVGFRVDSSESVNSNCQHIHHSVGSDLPTTTKVTSAHVNHPLGFNVQPLNVASTVPPFPLSEGYNESFSSSGKGERTESIKDTTTWDKREHILDSACQSQSSRVSRYAPGISKEEYHGQATIGNQQFSLQHSDPTNAIPCNAQSRGSGMNAKHKALNQNVATGLNQLPSGPTLSTPGVRYPNQIAPSPPGAQRKDRQSVAMAELSTLQANQVQANQAVGSTGGVTGTTGVVGNAPKGGIQGEDARGRWIERPTVSNPQVEHFVPSKHKCCNIL